MIFYGNGRFTTRRRLKGRRRVAKYRGRSKGRFHFGSWLKGAARSVEGAVNRVGSGLRTTTSFINRNAGDIAAAGTILAPEIVPAIGKGLVLSKGAGRMLGSGLYLAGQGRYKFTDAKSLFTGDTAGMIGGGNENSELAISHTEHIQDIFWYPRFEVSELQYSIESGIARSVAIFVPDCAELRRI